jgi:ArsR family transcriptional regulator
VAVKSKKAYELHAEFCKFMSNPKRIELIFLLGGREKRVEQLVGESGIRFSNVSQHLSVMKGKGIVETRRQGKNIFYRLSSGRILEACVIMRDLMIERMKRGKMK